MSDKAPAALAKAYIRMTSELERQKTEWTTTPPSEPGLYWAYSSRMLSRTGVVIVDYYFEEGITIVGKAVHTFHRNEYHRVDYFTHWLGPLTEPEPPK